jgi:hypothetical protein
MTDNVDADDAPTYASCTIAWCTERHDADGGWHIRADSAAVRSHSRESRQVFASQSETVSDAGRVLGEVAFHVNYTSRGFPVDDATELVTELEGLLVAISSADS